jgi:ribosomal protein L16 Arg81 hydroxylase
MEITLNKPEIFRKVFFPSIFTWEDVDTCLNSLPFYLNAEDPNFFTYIELINHESGNKSDPIIPCNNYEWPGLTHDVSFIFERIKLGDTFIISNLSRFNKDINDICKFLEDSTGTPADAHLYGSLSTHSKSFGIHRDNPHNIIVQIDGSCIWKVWEEEVLVIDDILYPGDVIYVPSLYYHQAIPAGKRLSISFPFGVTTNNKNVDRNWYTLR